MHTTSSPSWVANVLGRKQLSSRLTRSRGEDCPYLAHCTRPIPVSARCQYSAQQRKLLIFVHGAAMRSGGQRSTGNTFDNSAADDQLSVLHALREHAADHAMRQGFSTRILVDVPTAGWPVHYSTWWREACHRILGTNVRFSPHSDPAGSQVESIYRVFKWAATSLNWSWDAMLLTRPDLMLRDDLPLPCDVDAVAVPFDTRGLDQFCTQPSWTGGVYMRCGTAPAPYHQTAVAYPADSILWVPSQQHDAFLSALERKLHCRQEPQHLHDLCQYMRVKVLVSGQFDANSQKEYNPLYEMTGRPACGVSGLCLPSNASAAAMYRHRRNRLRSSRGGFWRGPSL